MKNDTTQNVLRREDMIFVGIILGRRPCFILSPLVQMRLTLLQRWTRDPAMANQNSLTSLPCWCSRIDLDTSWAVSCSYWETYVFCVLWLSALRTIKTWSFYWLSLKMKPKQRMAKLRGEEKGDQFQMTLFNSWINPIWVRFFHFWLKGLWLAQSHWL